MLEFLLGILVIFAFIITVLILIVMLLLVYNTSIQDEFIGRSKTVKEKVKNTKTVIKNKVTGKKPEKKKCENCKKVLDKDTVYCKYCGTKVKDAK